MERCDRNHPREALADLVEVLLDCSKELQMANLDQRPRRVALAVFEERTDSLVMERRHRCLDLRRGVGINKCNTREGLRQMAYRSRLRVCQQGIGCRPSELELNKYLGSSTQYHSTGGKARATQE